MQRITIVFLGLLVAALAAFSTDLLAAKAPTVTALLEGRDAATGGATLVVLGEKLTKFRQFELLQDGVNAGAVVLANRSRSMLILTLPEDLKPGTYELNLYDRKSHQGCVFVKRGLGAVRTSEYVNTWDGAMNYQVPEGCVVLGLESYHHNDREDRIWKVHYAPLAD